MTAAHIDAGWVGLRVEAYFADALGVPVKVLNDADAAGIAEIEYLGHMEVEGIEAEIRASSSTRKREGLSWTAWAERLEHVLEAYRVLFWPDLFILGGGVSKKHEKFMHLLDVNTRLEIAQLHNHAGIIGAAYASQKLR